MTKPSADTVENERHKLYVTDAELIRRLGVPERIARVVIQELDRNPRSGFPPKSKLWGDRRYWPAIVAYLDKLNGLNVQVPSRRNPA